MRADIDKSSTQLDHKGMTIEVGSQLASMTSAYSLDTNLLNELYGDDIDYATSMFETFLEEVLPEFDTIEPLLEQQRWEDVRQLAHKLRPTLGMVGLSDMEMLLAQFEVAVETSVESKRIHRLWHLFHADLMSCKPLVEAEWQRLLTKTKS